MRKYIFFALMVFVSSANLFAQGYKFDLVKIHKRAFNDDKNHPLQPEYYGVEKNSSFKVDTLFNSKGVIDSVVVTYTIKASKIRWLWVYNFSGNYLRYKRAELFLETPKAPKYKKSVLYQFNDGGFLEDEWPNKGDVWSRNSKNEPWSLFMNTDRGTVYFKDSVKNKILSVCPASTLDSLAANFGFEKNLFGTIDRKEVSSYSDRDSIRHVLGLRKQLSENRFAVIGMNNCAIRSIAVYEAEQGMKKRNIRIYENRGRDSYLCDTIGCFDLNADGEIVDGPKTRARRMKSYSAQINEFCDQDYITGLVKRAGLPDTLFYNSDSVYTYRAKGNSNRYLTRLVKQIGNDKYAEVIYNDISGNRCVPQFVNTYVWEDGKKRILTLNGVDVASQNGYWGASYCYGKKCVEVSNKNPYEVVEEDASVPKASNRKCPFEKKITAFETKMHVSKSFTKKSKIKKTYIDDDASGNVEYVIKSSPQTSDGYTFQYTYSFFDNCDVSSVSMVKMDAETEEPIENKTAVLRNDAKNTLYYVCDEQGKIYDDKCTCYDNNGKFTKKVQSSILCLDKEDLDAIRGGRIY